MSASFINQKRLYKQIADILKSKGLLFPYYEERKEGNKIYYRKRRMQNVKINRQTKS
jgi:hypothetical protein